MEIKRHVDDSDDESVMFVQNSMNVEWQWHHSQIAWCV